MEHVDTHIAAGDYCALLSTRLNNARQLHAKNNTDCAILNQVLEDAATELMHVQDNYDLKPKLQEKRNPIKI